LGLSQEWLRVDEGLCEIEASSNGHFLRTSVGSVECYKVGSDELELLGWKAAFKRCTSTLGSYLHHRSGEAWLTVADPEPDPESPFSELPVADLSIVYPRLGNYGAVPDPVLRLSFISPVWLSRLSLLKPELSRVEPCDLSKSL